MSNPVKGYSLRKPTIALLLTGRLSAFGLIGQGSVKVLYLAGKVQKSIDNVAET